MTKSRCVIAQLTGRKEPVGEPDTLEADGKCSDARHPKSRGMSRTYKYGAVTRDEDNVADGRFPTAAYLEFDSSWSSDIS
ncbi:MAG: hypothetical protein JRJ21_00060 [Deltaproteobacteria bacterium]|nr:hypothetical protein [Deltaproteobacteria bacterium]